MGHGLPATAHPGRRAAAEQAVGGPDAAPLNSAPRTAGGTGVVPPDAAAKPAFRPEVQGLRALAVGMVVVYHVWLGKVSGGVDVFLLISAFLLTGSLARRVEAGRPLKLFSYWLHRFKGLLPGVVVVLLGVLAATAFLLPRTRWDAIFSQTWASLFYVQNWVLAESSVDYYAADHSTASPLQHFWSLSIQGQVFILWPLLIGASALVWRRVRRSRPRLLFSAVLAVAFGTVFAASLAYSVHTTATNQAWAYFDTGARLWEFALGSLLALAVPHADRLPRVVRVVLGWTGVAAMLSCGFLLQVQAQFPGWVALWPTLAAGAVIAAGSTGSRFGADRWLSATPLARLAGLSYALYLWHWPVLVVYLAVKGKTEPGLAGGAGVIGLSLVLAWATTRAIETPLRSWSWPGFRRHRLALVLALLVAVVAAPLSGWQARVAADERAALAQPREDNPGAASLDSGFQFSGNPSAAVRPLASRVSDEWANYGGECRGEYMLSDPRMDYCQQAGNPDTATKTVIVLGDSHAQHWTAALAGAAERNGWAWILVNRPSCRFGAQSPERDAECNAFNDAATQYVLDRKPDAVLTVASLTAYHAGPQSEVPGQEERVVPGYVEGVQPFLDAGIDVVGMRDTPRYPFSIPECVDLNGPAADECSAPAAELLAEVSPLVELERQVADGRLPDGLSFFDMSDQLCPDGQCRPVIGNVLAYMDGSHLTRTYAETTSPVFEARFKAALGW